VWIWLVRPPLERPAPAPGADRVCGALQHWPTHRGLRLDVPIPAPAADAHSGHVKRTDVLGGLIHEYRRAA
jgi:hypothetical protein